MIMKPLILVIFAGSLYGQTQFGGPWVPVKGTTAALSSITSCVAGMQYFATDATAGANIYLCTTTGTPGTWTQVTGSGASLGVGLDFTRTSSTVLTALSTCTSGATCNVRQGDSVSRFATSSTATITAGTGTAFLYIDSAGTVTVGHNVTLTCSAGCTAVGGITAFPTGSIPLATWPATSGTWDSSGNVDYRAYISTDNITSSSGIVVTRTGTATSIAVDSATVPTYLQGSSTINFTSISSAACAENTFTLTGAAAGDSIAPGWPAALEAGLFGNMIVSATNTIKVRLCNLSGGSLDPASGVFTATIVRSF